MSTYKKTIFVTASLPMMIRNWIRTGILDRISNEYRIVLLAPFASATNFQKEFSQENIILENMEYTETFPTKLARQIFNAASWMRLLKSHQIDSLFFKKYGFRKNSYPKYVGYNLIHFLNKYGALEKAAKTKWEKHWTKQNTYNDLITKYKPIAILSTHPYLHSEWPILLHGKIHNIPLLGFIHSWDNPTNRGELPFRFQKVMVWSQFKKQLLLKYNNWLQPHDVSITGAPHFDLFFHKDYIEPKASFLSQLGIDPSKPLIFIAGGDKKEFPDQIYGIVAILESIEGGMLPKTCQVWIRFYGDDSYKEILPYIDNRKGVFWEKASSEFWGKFRIENDWKAESGFKHYLNILRHSDAVVLLPATTVALDAAVLNKPMIQMVYDGTRSIPFPNSVRRYCFGSSHYQRVVRTGAVKLALDEEEFIQYIKTSLQHPEIERQCREVLVEEVCGPVDGKACERISSEIIRQLGNISNSKTNSVSVVSTSQGKGHLA